MKDSVRKESTVIPAGEKEERVETEGERPVPAVAVLERAAFVF